MRKAPTPQHPNRSGDEWLVGEAKRVALLKAPVGVDPNQPPSIGWLSYNNGEYKEEVNLTCTNQPEAPCSSLRVRLRGEAKKENPWCEGEYTNTGLISMGRQVIYIVITPIFGHCYMISL